LRPSVEIGWGDAADPAGLGVGVGDAPLTVETHDPIGDLAEQVHRWGVQLIGPSPDVAAPLYILYGRISAFGGEIGHEQT
jgi:hypothetical protein